MSAARTAAAGHRLRFDPLLELLERTYPDTPMTASLPHAACAAPACGCCHAARDDDDHKVDLATAYGPGADGFLLEAADAIDHRAAERDTPEGERSMARATAMFNAWRGPRHGDGALTEHEGWVFMACLKLARPAGGDYRRDDYVDGAAYIALAGECAGAGSHTP